MNNTYIREKTFFLDLSLFLRSISIIPAGFMVPKKAKMDLPLIENATSHATFPISCSLYFVKGCCR